MIEGLSLIREATTDIFVVGKDGFACFGSVDDDEDGLDVVGFSVAYCKDESGQPDYAAG